MGMRARERRKWRIMRAHSVFAGAVVPAFLLRAPAPMRTIQVVQRFLPFVVILLAPLAAACGSTSAQSHDAGIVDPLIRNGEALIVPPGSPLRTRLRIEEVTLQPVRDVLTAPAEVEADPARLARITPPVAGRVVQIYVRFGDVVTAGQPLLVLDSSDMVAAQADYLHARSELGQAERTLNRQSDLASHGIGAQRDVEQASTQRDLATQEVERSAQRLHLYGLSPGQIGRPLTVRSPVAGRVVAFHVAPGEYHDPTDLLMTVADLSTVWVTANVQEKDLRRVHAGDEADASFLAYPNENWDGHVLFVGELLDPDTRTLEVRVAFDNSERRLHPGMFATVAFRGNPTPEIVVPTTAAVLMGDASYVFVENGDWRFEKRRVETGASIDPTHLVITEGLHSGEHIVTANAILLQ